jgi:hypothetical protein
MTKVIFRKFRNGEVIALFPDEKERGGKVGSYMHIGQHGMADRGIVGMTKLATPTEYAPLLSELRSIGYDDLVIRKRMTR